MKIKSKIYLGIIFLFAEFIIITAISTFYLYHISNQTALIMKDNNISVKYAENMLDAIVKINDVQTSMVFNQHYMYDVNTLNASMTVFEKNLASEENNITEIGEKDIIQSVRTSYEKIKNLLTSPLYEQVKKTPDYYFSVFLPAYSELRTKIFDASNVNIQAIERKTRDTKKTVSIEFTIILIVSTICFLVTFSFIFNFPYYITRPIVDLTKRVRDISNYNYSMRLNYKTTDEIGELANEFDSIITVLEKYEQERHILKQKGLPEENNIGELIKTHLQSIKENLDSLESLNINSLLLKHNELLEKIKSGIESSSELITGSVKE